MVQRTGDVIARWVVWCVVGWLAYCVVLIAVELLYLHRQLPARYVGGLLFYNALAGTVVAGLVCAAVFIPYSYAVAAKPQWKFLGESTGWWTGTWRALIVGAIAAVVLALTWHGGR